MNFIKLKYFFSTMMIVMMLLVNTGTVFSAPPPVGGYAPGAELDPDCAPGDDDCFVNPLWSYDSIYETLSTDYFVGIGTNIARGSLDIVGNDEVLDALAVSNFTPGTDSTSSDDDFFISGTYTGTVVQSLELEVVDVTPGDNAVRVVYNGVEVVDSIPLTAVNAIPSITFLDLLGEDLIPGLSLNSESLDGYTVGDTWSFVFYPEADNFLTISDSSNIRLLNLSSEGNLSLGTTQTGDFTLDINGGDFRQFQNIAGVATQIRSSQENPSLGNNPGIGLDYINGIDGYQASLAIGDGSFIGQDEVILMSINNTDLSSATNLHMNRGLIALDVNNEGVGSEIILSPTLGTIIEGNGTDNSTTVFSVRGSDELEFFKIFNGGMVVFNERNYDDGDVQMKGSTESNLFYLDSSQDAIGIGTNTPSARLHVNDTGAGAGDDVAIFQSGAGASCSFGPTGLNCSSDERLKENVSTLTNNLDIVNQLNPVNFEWISDDNNTQNIGFIAQEVELIVPELVGESFNGYKSVNYQNFVPILAGAIQELSSQIANQIANFTELIVDIIKVRRAEVSEEICIGTTCIDEARLRELLGEEPIPEPEIETPESPDSEPTEESDQGAEEEVVESEGVLEEEAPVVEDSSEGEIPEETPITEDFPEIEISEESPEPEPTEGGNQGAEEEVIESEEIPVETE